jgi:enamine deaminase RidA (YjgF/YER057c/UK114 family)
MHAGNMRQQLDQAFRNLATVLEAAGFTLGKRT